MGAVPGLPRELIRWQDLQLVCPAVPTIEVIAAPPFRRDFHVGGSLPVGVTIEAGVPNHGVQQCSRNELIGIGEADGNSASAVVRGRTLRDQRIDVGEVELQGENIDVEVQHVPRRKYQLKVREGRDASRLDLILRKRQPAHRLSPQFVGNLFGEIHLVLDERAIELKSWRPVGKPHQVIVLSPECRDEITKLVIPYAGGRLRFDRRQAACKTSVLRALRQTVNGHGLNDVNRNGNRKASRDGIHVFRRVNNEHSLAFSLPLERQSARGSPNDTRYQRQSLCKFLGRQRQTLQLIGVDRGSYRYILRGNLGGLSLNFDLLIDGTNLQNNISSKRLVRSEGYRSEPGLKAIATCFQCVGSGGKMSELVAAVRIGHRRLGC